MSKRKVAAAITLVGAGVWLWRQRPVIERVRRELAETGKLQFGTMLAAGLLVWGVFELAPEIQRAVKRLS